MKIKLAIADDHKMLRETLCDKLDKEKDIAISGSFGDGPALLDFIKHEPVDVILLDIDMPKMDSHELLLEILAFYPAQKVIMISFHNDAFHINKFMKAGASAYLKKVNGYIEILETIRAVHERGVFITPDIKDALVSCYLQDNKVSNKVKKLNFSDRELEIIKLVCEDKTAKEIGTNLFIESKTVEGHKSRIREKLGVKSSIGIVVYAVATGIYSPGSIQYSLPD